MSELKKVHVVKDDSGHWYVIPSEMVEDFDNLLDGGEETELEFIAKFSGYKTGGSANLIQLYADIK